MLRNFSIRQFVIAESDQNETCVKRGGVPPALVKVYDVLPNG